MKKIKYIVGALVLVLSLQSCESLLEQDNPNTVTTDNAVNTLNGINRINLGAYTNSGPGQIAYDQSIITDEVVYPLGENQNQGGGRGLYAWEYSPGTVTDRDNIRPIWLGYYQMVNRTNVVINGIDNIEVLTDSDKNLKQLYKAEAYGLRAFAHFEILRSFSPKYNASALGIPYKTVNNNNENPARLTMQESYAKILEDLNTAINTFPTTLPTGYGGTYGNNRLTKAALLGIKARINLEMGNYDEAISNATQAIGSRTLVTKKEELINLWSDANDYNEVIFKQSNINGASSYDLGGNFVYSTGQVQWNSSATLMNKYSADDIRNALFIKQIKTITTTEFITGKYQMPYANGVKSTFGRADIKILRTADLLLLRSEAYARKGDLTNALVGYKAVRDARNAGVSTAFASQSVALANILDERARELAYEGSRLNDLKRFDKTISRVAADTRPNYPTLNMTETNKLTYPITQTEMFANENMVQNPGW